MHDNKVYETLGIDMCSLVVNGFQHENRTVKGRDDLKYLGQYSRFVLFPQDVTIQMLHPRGGNTYAMTYPAQKRHREMKTESRPDIQISGHMHTFFFIRQDYTFFIGLPGLQDETEFFVREGYGRQMGCCVMEYKIENRRMKSVSIRYEVLE